MNWSYIAGFFDGEGYVAPANHVEMAQKYPAVLEQIGVFLNGEGIHSKLDYNKTTKSWILRVSRREEVEKFITAILPLSIVKKTQLQDNRRFFTMYPSRHTRIVSLGQERRLWERFLLNGKLSQKDFAETATGAR